MIADAIRWVEMAISSSETDRFRDFQRKHPSGLVTLLFTDMVGGAALKQRLGEDASMAVFQRHDALVVECLSAFDGGEIIEKAGDSFFIVFAVPSQATAFALTFQSRLRRLAKETGQPLSDRIGIHLGEVMQCKPDQETGLSKLFGSTRWGWSFTRCWWGISRVQ